MNRALKPVPSLSSCRKIPTNDTRMALRPVYMPGHQPSEPVTKTNERKILPVTALPS